MIDEEHLDLAAIVGIDRAGRVEHGDAVLRASPERGRTCASVPGGSAIAMPVGTAA